MDKEIDDQILLLRDKLKDKEMDVLIIIHNNSTKERFITGYGCAICMIESLIQWTNEENVQHAAQDEEMVKH